MNIPDQTAYLKRNWRFPKSSNHISFCKNPFLSHGGYLIFPLGGSPSHGSNPQTTHFHRLFHPSPRPSRASLAPQGVIATARAQLQETQGAEPGFALLAFLLGHSGWMDGATGGGYGWMLKVQVVPLLLRFEGFTVGLLWLTG